MLGAAVAGVFVLFFAAPDFFWGRIEAIPRISLIALFNKLFFMLRGLFFLACLRQLVLKDFRLLSEVTGEG